MIVYQDIRKFLNLFDNRLQLIIGIAKECLCFPNLEISVIDKSH